MGTPIAQPRAVAAGQAQSPNSRGWMNSGRNHGRSRASKIEPSHSATRATRPVYEKWKKTVGVDLVNAAEKAVAARK